MPGARHPLSLSPPSHLPWSRDFIGAPRHRLAAAVSVRLWRLAEKRPERGAPGAERRAAGGGRRRAIGGSRAPDSSTRGCARRVVHRARHQAVRRTGRGSSSVDAPTDRLADARLVSDRSVPPPRLTPCRQACPGRPLGVRDVWRLRRGGSVADSRAVGALSRSCPRNVPPLAGRRLRPRGCGGSPRTPCFRRAHSCACRINAGTNVPCRLGRTDTYRPQTSRVR